MDFNKWFNKKNTPILTFIGIGLVLVIICLVMKSSSNSAYLYVELFTGLFLAAPVMVYFTKKFLAGEDYGSSGGKLSPASKILYLWTAFILFFLIILGVVKSKYSSLNPDPATSSPEPTTTVSTGTPTGQATVTPQTRDTANAGTTTPTAQNQSTPTPEVITSTPVPTNVKMYLYIQNDSNLIYAKYDIYIHIDGAIVGTVKNGELFTKLLETTSGKHTIKFSAATDKKVFSENEFTINADSTVKCTLKAHESSIELLKGDVIAGVQGAEIEMPDLVGVMLPEAKKKLQAVSINQIKTKTNSTEVIVLDSNWIVLEQSITAGSTVNSGTEVLLTCSRISDFVGIHIAVGSVKEALDKAYKMGFSIECIDVANNQTITFTQDDSTYSNWEIYDYEANSNSSKTAKLTLMYKGIATVPNVVRLTAAQARNTLFRSHFPNVEFYNDDNRKITDENKWIVTEQSEEPFVEIDNSITIRLKVKEDIPPTPTPSEEELLQQQLQKELEEKFPKEMAYRAVVVAITNYYALDVFTNGDTDSKKFHSYADKSGNKDAYYLEVKYKGSWSTNDGETWHVEGIKLYKPSYKSTFVVTADVKTTKDGYEIYNVIDAGATSASNEHLYPDSAKEFKVTKKMVEKSR